MRPIVRGRGFFGVKGEENSGMFRGFRGKLDVSTRCSTSGKFDGVCLGKIRSERRV